MYLVFSGFSHGLFRGILLGKSIMKEDFIMKNLFIFMYIVGLCFTLFSCSSLDKEAEVDPNNMIGGEVSDISTQDINLDNKGSDSGTIEGLSTVYFAYDSSFLSEEAKAALQENLSWIQSHTEVKNLELEGHCDAMGSESYNIGLGRRRAESVKNFLIAQGIEASRLSIISYGEERPLSETEYSKNRRVNFVPIY